MSGNSPAELGFVKTPRATSGRNARDRHGSGFARLDAELWLARRLGRNGVLVESLFDGPTDPAERRRRLRQAIVDRGVAEITCGRRAGKPITYADAFARIYGERP